MNGEAGDGSCWSSDVSVDAQSDLLPVSRTRTHYVSGEKTIRSYARTLL